MFEVFSTPPTDRFFEDYKVGGTYLLGSFTLTEQEIIDFATVYDPQVMHINPSLAAEGPFGEVIASGWHTVARSMPLFVETFLPYNGLAAPGIDEVRWPRPVRPGDTLTVHVTIQAARRSRTKPDRGLLQLLMEIFNQNNELVLTMKPTNMVRTRNPES